MAKYRCVEMRFNLFNKCRLFSLLFLFLSAILLNSLNQVESKPSNKHHRHNHHHHHHSTTTTEKPEEKDDGDSRSSTGDEKENTTTTTAKPTTDGMGVETSTTTTVKPDKKEGGSSTSHSPAKNDNDNKHKEGGNHTTNIKTGRRQAKGHHRVLGGQVQDKVPAWLGTNWSPDMKTEGHDGKYVGNSIRVDKNLFLATGKSLGNTTDSRYIEPDDIHDQHKQVVYNNPLTINPEKGGSDEHRLRRIDPVHSNVADSPFDLYRLNVIKTPYDAPALPKGEGSIANLERDFTQFGKDGDCHLYGYDRANRESGGSNEAPNMNNRPFVRIPVNLDKSEGCSGGSCSLTTSDFRDTSGSICSGLGDQAAPVVCGEKVTYLATPGVNDDDCKNNVKAWHVPHLAKDIDEWKQSVTSAPGSAPPADSDTSGFVDAGDTGGGAEMGGGTEMGGGSGFERRR